MFFVRIIGKMKFKLYSRNQIMQFFTGSFLKWTGLKLYFSIFIFIPYYAESLTDFYNKVNSEHLSLSICLSFPFVHTFLGFLINVLGLPAYFLPHISLPFLGPHNSFSCLEVRLFHMNFTPMKGVKGIIQLRETLVKSLFLVSKITPESTEPPCCLLRLEISVLHFLKRIQYKGSTIKYVL